MKTDINSGRFNLHLDSCVPVPEKSKIDLIEFSGLHQGSNGGTMKMNFEKISRILAIIFSGLTIVTAVYAVNYPWKCRGFYRTYGHHIRILALLPKSVKSNAETFGYYLAEREKEVLALIIHDLNNNQNTEKLVVIISTAKLHAISVLSEQNT